MNDTRLFDWHGCTILFMVRSLEMGGTQRQVGYLAPWLQQNSGARVMVLALERRGPLADLLEHHGIPWELHSGLLASQKIVKTLSLLKLLFRIRKIRPDIVLSFNDFPNKVCGAIWTWTGAKICVWNQRDEGLEVTGRFLERRALRQVPLFIANSLQGVNFLTRRLQVPAERIKVIHNGVRLTPPQQDRAFWRQQMKIAPAALVAVMAANNYRYKDHDTLLRAWALVQEQAGGSEFHLVFAGKFADTSATLHRRCEKLNIARRVHFLGHVDDITGLLKAAEIGVFSSQCEGMPNAVLEGMAAGLPLVATNIIGIREALGDDYPLLTPPGDASAMARGLLGLMNNEGLRKRLGDRNQQRVQRFFSVEFMAQQFADLIAPYVKSGIASSFISPLAGENEMAREKK